MSRSARNLRALRLRGGERCEDNERAHTNHQENQEIIRVAHLQAKNTPMVVQQYLLQYRHILPHAVGR
jgi:hypothetical protein